MITDTFLTQVAKAINSESYTVPNYLAVGTGAVTSIGTTDTALTTEIGLRSAVTGSRANSQVLFSGIRSSTVVVNTTSGDVITNAGLLNGTSTGTLMVGEVISGLTQTTAFDVQWDWYIEVKRTI
jgi:hypothetical protein